MARIKTIGSIGFAGLLACLAAACGGGDTVAPVRTASEAADEEDEWEENGIPVIEWVRFEPDAPAVGATLTARVRVDDPDGDELELGFDWRINGRPTRTPGPTLALGNTMKGDEVSVTVIASDGWDESDPVTVRTAVGNAPPVLQSIAFDPLGTIHRGQRVSARPIAQDPDGDRLEYEFTWWVNDRELSDRRDVLDTSQLRRGDEVRVRVVAKDGYARSNEITSEPIRVENSPPTIASEPANAGDAEVYRYQVRAEDPDGDRRLRFRLEEAPPGMTIDPITGLLEWAAPASATGSHAVTLVVDDLQGGVAQQRFTVEIGEEEPAPAATPAAGSAPAPAAPAAPQP